MAFTAGSVMDRSASLLNDTAKSVYTYVAQLPYLGVAYDELREILQENNVPITFKLSANYTITTAITDIGGAGGLLLPTDLVELEGVFERTSGSTEDFIEMNRVNFLPKITQLSTNLEVYAWIGQVIQFIGATGSRQVQINYISNGLIDLVDDTTSIPLINGKNFLAFRNAALCAEFIGENQTRADKLNKFADGTIERVLNISAKSKQVMITRRRPFMARFKLKGG